MTLKEKIIEKIKAEGPINFETFMEIALYDRESGYYMRDNTKIGICGDFYTSSHLHPIFGAMLGKQMEEMRGLIECQDVFNIVEIGAGMGHLAKDMLEYLRERGKLEQFNYYIVEMNPFLKMFQQVLLQEFQSIRWFSTLRELPPMSGCFLSNELLDAFPVRLIDMDEELSEIYIAVNNNDLEEEKYPCSKEVMEYLREFSIDLSSMKPCRTEINLKVKDWLNLINDKIKEGFILTIDYGYPAAEYYSEERNRGTLLCYHQHRISENPYINIGQQDITAHVNFSALDKWGTEIGLKTIGFCPQGTYLISLGIDELITELYEESPDIFDLAKIKGLIFPEGMGESHKIMIQYKGISNPQLRGFALRNQQKKLKII